LKRKKYTKIPLLFLLVLALTSGGIFVGLHWQHWFGDASNQAIVDEQAETYTGNKETYTGKKNTETIDIPGFDSINFKADTPNQSVNLYNPEQNICYFKISLYLKDGTRLWESQLIEPGQAIYQIELQQTLTAGTYSESILKYECFSMNEEQTPLNGSEVKCTLNVLS